MTELREKPGLIVPPWGIRDVLVWVEIVVVWVEIARVEPCIVSYIAPGASMDNSAKAAHPRIDRQRRVLAHVADDGRLASGKNQPRLETRLIAIVCANQI